MARAAHAHPVRSASGQSRLRPQTYPPSTVYLAWQGSVPAQPAGGARPPWTRSRAQAPPHARFAGVPGFDPWGAGSPSHASSCTSECARCNREHGSRVMVCSPGVSRTTSRHSGATAYAQESAGRRRLAAGTAGRPGAQGWSGRALCRPAVGPGGTQARTAAPRPRSHCVPVRFCLRTRVLRSRARVVRR